MDLTVEKIREEFGYILTRTTILNWIRKAGVISRSKSQPKNMKAQANREIIKTFFSITIFHSSSITPEKIMVLEEEIEA